MAKYLVLFLNRMVEGRMVYSYRFFDSCLTVLVLDTNTLICIMESFQTKEQMLSLGQCIKDGTDVMGKMYGMTAFYNPFVSFDKVSNVEYIVRVVNKEYRFVSATGGIYLDNKHLLPHRVDANPNLETWGYLNICLVCSSDDGLYRLVFYVRHLGFLNIWMDVERLEALCYAWSMDFSMGVYMFPDRDAKKFNALLGRLAKSAMMQGRLY